MAGKKEWGQFLDENCCLNDRGMTCRLRIDWYEIKYASEDTLTRSPSSVTSNSLRSRRFPSGKTMEITGRFPSLSVSFNSLGRSFSKNLRGNRGLVDMIGNIAIQESLLKISRRSNHLQITHGHSNRLAVRHLKAPLNIKGLEMGRTMANSKR